MLAVDNRGHGDSQADPGYRYHNAAIARDVTAVVEALHLTPVTLVGHSQGGHACLRFAGRSPERVTRLVLIDAGPDVSAGGSGAAGDALRLLAPEYESTDAYEALLAEIHPRLGAADRSALARHSLRATADGRLVPRLDPRFLRKESKRAAESRVAFDREAWAATETERLWQSLARITCPTLVIRGAGSTLLSAATMRRMVGSVLADGRGIEIPDAGHTVMLDAPTAFRDALRGFLRV